MRFPIIPCDLCGSQEGLQRNAMKAMLEDIEKRMPGRKDTMIRALTNVRPSHLLDRGLFDFAGLNAAMRTAVEAAPAFDGVPVAN
jgi:tRNA 2-thiocytidine biosynthesis protein TtcA